jgi:hypothetical protein
MLPFAGGAAGIGMVRVPEEELERNAERADKGTQRQPRASSGKSEATKRPEASEKINYRDLAPSDPKEFSH